MPHAPAVARTRRETARVLALDGIFVGRVALTAVLAWWATVLLLPGASFIGPSFTWFVALASEGVWAAVCAAGALICGSAIFVRRRGWRFASGLVAACVYGLLAYGLWCGNPRGTGTGTYLVLALWANWLSYRNIYPPGDAPCRGCLCRDRWCHAKRDGGAG